MKAKVLSKTQQETLNSLSGHFGKEVLVLTSTMTAAIDPEAVASAVCTTTNAALRGLEARGYIKAKHFWRGAMVSVLKTD